MDTTFNNIIFKEIKVILLPNRTMEHAKPNTPLESLIYDQYPENNQLCIVNFLTSYIVMWITLMGEEIKDFTISFGKPYKKVSQDATSRWIKSELAHAGFNKSVFKAHNCLAQHPLESKGHWCFIKWNTETGTLKKQIYILNLLL